MKKIETKITKRLAFFLLGWMWLFASCGDIYDLNAFEWEPETLPSDSVYNREIQILDWGNDNVPEGHRALDGEDARIFSLEKFSSVHLGYKVSTRWDLAFQGPIITTNNGSKQGVGYGSSAMGGIVMLDSAYSEVTSVPDDSRFVVPGNYSYDAVTGAVGYVHYTFLGNALHPEMIEWANGNDGEKQGIGRLYQHMTYPLSEAYHAAYPKTEGGYQANPKTFIIRTANGNYAKLEVQSFYKGTIEPMDMNRSLSRPYYSFRYMVIPASEKRFGFVARKPPLTVDMTKNTITVGKLEDDQEK